MRLQLIATCAVAAFFSSTSSAALLQVQVVEIANNYPGDAVPAYSAAVVANDPIFGNTSARTFDLVVSATAGALWSSAEVQINSPLQTIYYKAGSSPTNPLTSSWAAQPAAQFSTFLCVPTLSRLGGTIDDPGTGGTLLGKAQVPVESGVGPAIITTTAIDAAWGDTSVAGNSGTFTVARITLLNSLGGGVTFAGRVGAANNVPAPTVFSFTTQEIPEPSVLGVVAFALPLMRKRKIRVR